MITNLVSKEIWNDRYRKNGETFDESLKRVAKYIGTNDKEIDDFYSIMKDGLFYPAGRTMSNSGIGKSLTLNNCFTLNSVPDNMEGIFDYVKYGAITQKAGGGTGYNFSLLRPKGTPTSNDAIASGVVSFMNAFDSQTHTVLQGSRRGANMGCLCIYHPDVLEFLESKSWDEGKLTHFNLSVLVDDKFMESVKNNENIKLHFPCMTDDGKFIYDESKWKITKEINAKELWDKIIRKAYDTGEYGVLYYDNMNKDNNLYYMENIVTTNPCGEYLSGVLNLNGEVLYDHFGACNLGSIFLHNFVENPFTKNADINYDKLNYAVRIGVRLLDNIIDINNYPLVNFENYQKNIRTIGLGISGLADMFVMLNIKYGSEESIKLTDKLMNFIVATAYHESTMLAKEKGEFNYLNREKFVESNFIKKHIEKDPDTWNKIKDNILKYGIRNGRLISVAPTGTISLSYGNNCSSGLEPIFSLEYDREVKIGGQEEENKVIVNFKDYAYDEWLKFKCEENIVKEDVFVTAMSLSVEDHVNILSTIAYHTDMSCSKTVNVPTDYPFEDTKKLYMDCWEKGIKGCTIFRPNEIRRGILLTNNNNEKEEVVELKRGEWEKKPEDCIEIARKIYTGCGKELLHITISPKNKRIIDFYITSSSTGGCKLNIQAVAISMSGMLRIGGSLDNIKCAYRGMGGCPSFATARAKGRYISKGNSCPMAILNVLLDVEKDLKLEQLKELSMLGYYNHDEKEEIIENDIKIDKDIVIFTEEEIKFKEEFGEISYAQKYNKCPQCGELLVRVGSCATCNNCSWSKCE